MLGIWEIQLNDGRNYTVLFILLGKISTMLIVGTQESQVKNNVQKCLPWAQYH